MALAVPDDVPGSLDLPDVVPDTSAEPDVIPGLGGSGAATGGNKDARQLTELSDDESLEDEESPAAASGVSSASGSPREGDDCTGGTGGPAGLEGPDPDDIPGSSGGGSSNCK